ncbi:MAG TPA: DUF3106 domain-containing protein [Lysobacter sp.]|jgi:hypothetical protein|nr:DUF3106 domain-containing protein [Lysobacter sp.]
MKPIRLLPLLLLPMLSANAQQSPTALPAWDQLSDAQRAELVAPLRDRWNRSPEERTRMLERAQRWQAMPAGKRMQAERGLHRWEHMDPARRAQMQALFEKTRDMPPQQRRETFALFRALLPLDAAQRQALLQRWRSMTPAQRDEWLESHRPRHRGHGDD